MESFLANDLEVRFVLASGKHKGNAFNDRKLYVLIVSIRYLMRTCNFSYWKNTTALIAAWWLCVLSTPQLVCSGIHHLQAAHEAPGEGFPPLTWLGKSCNVLNISVRLLFSRFGYKNLLVSNRDMYYGLSFTVRIMFRLAMKALSMLAEEKTLAALARNCFQLLWSLFLLWATLSTRTDRSLQCFFGTAEVRGCVAGSDVMH